MRRKQIDQYGMAFRFLLALIILVPLIFLVLARFDHTVAESFLSLALATVLFAAMIRVFHLDFLASENDASEVSDDRYSLIANAVSSHSELKQIVVGWYEQEGCIRNKDYQILMKYVDDIESVNGKTAFLVTAYNS